MSGYTMNSVYNIRAGKTNKRRYLFASFILHSLENPLPL